ncbi:DedA family protein [Amycolatopsis cihanbeyliensis]|uniref:Membrane protein DedA with SNARE-associated domain n=1 Tax=Amycolatopsis cihanbeyliensis TaxID=1128664 RepID=A0A542DGD7_AMYCI|nr:DedA family protein [Amycolatopsis cihanbeyliensis]TQJ02147.1 membrane protein DedA with SNARE-associated domain [Amycolatopsis cihanbeyliensis]
MFEDLMPDLGALPPLAVLATVFVLAFLETSLLVGVFLPGEVLLAGCIGVLHVTWSPLAGLVAAAGCFAGQLVGYLIGRRVGPALQRGWIGRKTDPRRWEQAEQLVRSSGGWLLVTARFVAVAHTLAPALAGVLRMPLRRFAWFAALSSAVWAALWTAVGAGLGQAGQLLDQGLLTTALVLGGIVISTLVVGRVLRKPAEDMETVPERAQQPVPLSRPAEPTRWTARTTV